MHNLRQYPLPLQRYMSMMDLQVIPFTIFFYSFESLQVPEQYDQLE
jgi:hypothetical protein